MLVASILKDSYLCSVNTNATMLQHMACIFFNSDQVLISNSAFQGSGNETLDTGSVYSEHSNVTILNGFFEGNSTSSGGAITIIQESILTITGSVFSGNRARDIGGAISATGDSMINLEGTRENLFKDNVGGQSGGALDCTGCSLKMKGNSTFIRNSLDHDCIRKKMVEL